MRTLYIDVYFMINFTVDAIALYFAAIFAQIPTTVRRITLASVLGAVAACAIVLVSEILWLRLVLTVLSLIGMGMVGASVSGARRLRYIALFIVFEALVGGIVTFVWDLLDRYAYEILESSSGGSVNRRLLLFSVIVLLSFGVFKMLVSFFSKTRCEGSVLLEICFLGQTVRTEAFVDSGNLAIDPMDMRPVMLLKRRLAEEFLPQGVLHLSDPDLLDRDIRRRIRLIPVSRGGVTHVLVGVRADKVSVISDEGEQEVSVTLAIDREEGSFGGFDALMPSAALDYVL